MLSDQVARGPACAGPCCLAACRMQQLPKLLPSGQQSWCMISMISCCMMYSALALGLLPLHSSGCHQLKAESQHAHAPSGHVCGHPTAAHTLRLLLGRCTSPLLHPWTLADGHKLTLLVAAGHGIQADTTASTATTFPITIASASATTTTTATIVTPCHPTHLASIISMPPTASTNLCPTNIDAPQQASRVVPAG
jgi:hypothetical protein